MLLMIMLKQLLLDRLVFFYDGEYCLGGGIVKTVMKDKEKLWYLL